MKSAKTGFVKSFAVKSLAVASLVLTAACAGQHPATRALDFQDVGGGSVVAVPTDYRLEDVNVRFAPNLKVSEANRYYPIADIVWRGDSYGDRFAQISAIFEEGMGRTADRLDGSVPVVADVEITRFHSLTEKTRYSVGGSHSIHFNLTLRDARSGAILDGPRAVDASFPGLGGQAAIQAEARGDTQKVRILARLDQVLTEELTRPIMAAQR